MTEPRADPSGSSDISPTPDTIAAPGAEPRAATTTKLAVGALAVAAVGLLFALVVTVGLIGPDGGGAASTPSSDDPLGGLDLEGGGGGSEAGGPADPDADPTEVLASAAAAMGEVTSGAFSLDLSGDPVFIDQFESIALDSLLGQFTIPRRAVARLEVEVDASLRTRIGAVAIDEEVWISNPVTGTFETLPPGYDIDPSRFFDPAGGWQPLLAGLEQVELVGVDDRGGERWHIRGVAPAERVADITAGLVDDQDVPVDLWIRPRDFLVTAAELTTTIGDGETSWVLELDRYGEEFTIEPPENVS